ncbi:MAG: threonylcarbamoyl-AMP synthase [Spirochaetaceae bacterium]|jgi:L-threonylcarbamoyladenylate synthase|nr:threonylcarbamoyl-AMP synthase [Spirochaetaceae bacterium]
MIRLGTSAADLGRAAAIIKAGGLAIFPTETVYGLGADAFNTHALARVFDVKGRPRFDPLIIHIAGFSALERIADLDALGSPERLLLEKLAKKFWPGPLTFVLPKRPEVPDLATAALPTAAIRFPSQSAAQKLIELSGGAVAAPSANRFGRISPTRAEHAVAELGDAADCIIDGGPCSVGVESTVLSIQGGLKILRPGGISREQIEELAGPLPEGNGISANLNVPQDTTQRTGIIISGNKAATMEEGEPAASPGMLKSHYAPERPLFFYGSDVMQALPCCPEDGYLFFSGTSRKTWAARTGAPDTDRIITLSESGDAVEAAARLFEYLRLLDGKGVRRIHAEALPEKGIGAAVNDRLRRAAG